MTGRNDGDHTTVDPTFVTGEKIADRPARTKAGRFELLWEIGSGGMGVVYRAMGEEGPAAVKVVPVSASPRLRLRFTREAKIRIEHPNIVSVLDAGICDDGSPYIAFELLEGEGLDEVLGRGPLPPEEAVRIGLDACAGLSAAHRQGVIHRDLKPSNLYLTRDGRVKILDFGIARLHLDTDLTATGDVIGTPSYISPEQARGRPDVDHKADVWGLGAVLYHALAGRPPHKASTVLGTLVAVVMDDVVPLAEAMPGTPPDLAEVIDRALERDPEKRWQDIDAFRAALAGAELVQSNLRIAKTSSGLIASGERRVVAVMLAEGVSDLGRIEEAVASQGGILIPLVGGRAIGLFGGRTWEGDELNRAAHAALTSRSAAKRMAVASGRATRVGRSISGEVLENAERGLRANLQGVAVDPDTGHSLARSFALTEQSGVFEIASEQSSDLLVQLDSPLVGRAAELAQIERAVRVAFSEERAYGLLIHGPPGIGKTRLRIETAKQLDAHDIRVVTGRAQPNQMHASLALLRNTIEELARGTIAGTLDERRARIVALANDAGLAGGDRDTPTFLGELLGVPMPETVELEAARTDPELMADRLRFAVLDYLEGLALSAPLALMLDDLHWADAASLSVLVELMNRVGDLPFLLFATARPEFDGGSLFTGADRAQIEPQGLLADDVSDLALKTHGVRPSPDLAKRIAEHCGGNPLFVEQILVELDRSRSLDEHVDELPLPLTVEAAVQSRLDHMGADLKEAAKRLALHDRPFTQSEAAVVGVDSRAVDALIPRGILISQGKRQRDVERKLRFRSAVVRDVAYGMLAADVVAELHRKVALHLEKSPASEPAEVALHFDRAGERQKASEFFARAALAAARRGESALVLAAADRAFELGPPPGTHFSLHMAKSDALQFLGRRDEQEIVLDAALTCAPTLADFARVATEMVAWMSRMGRWQEALENADAAVESARESKDPEVLGLALGRKAVALVYAGQLEMAESLLSEAEAVSSDGAGRLGALLASWRAQLEAAKGDLGARTEAYRLAVERFTAMGDIRRAAGAEVNLADAYNRLGDYDRAKSALEVALEHCKTVGNRPMEGYALVNLGYALTMLGEVDAALSALDRASTLAHRIREVRLDVIARVYRARALLGRADPRELSTGAERLAGEAESQRVRPFAVTALAIAAEAAIAAKDRARSMELSERALALRDELGGIEEDEADVFRVRARALFEAGLAEEAKAVLERGRRRLDEVSRGIDDPALRAKFMAGGHNRRLFE
jgi:tetratricopeptide (TPR) repeat protein